MRKSRLWLMVCWLIGLSSARVGRTYEINLLPTFSFEEFYLAPLRVHLLQSQDVADLHCRLTEKDVLRILGKVNKIWAQAGIQFCLESLVIEEAVHQEEYKALNGSVPLEFHLRLRPEASKAEGMFHVYYLHNMSVNGVYLQADGIFVKDSARLREVEGGMDEPLPRVTAHELGHALGLSHRQDRVNLMASGTTGFSLNDMEIERARAKAKSLKWIRSVADVAQMANENFLMKNVREAKKLYEWLVAIPGESAVKELAKRRLEMLRKQGA
ncbi:MAG: matrixin family metalloprotease [Abditibacteriales bacterium]|nr:matrixin family metalloprotease [Abditibacteriales bacterium]MDW8367259.1 matrixin family metalloprotease [Abditibacteriales bacterium]